MPALATIHPAYSLSSQGPQPPHSTNSTIPRILQREPRVCAAPRYDIAMLTSLSLASSTSSLSSNWTSLHTLDICQAMGMVLIAHCMLALMLGPNLVSGFLCLTSHNDVSICSLYLSETFCSVQLVQQKGRKLSLRGDENHLGLSGHQICTRTQTAKAAQSSTSWTTADCIHCQRRESPYYIGLCSMTY